MSHESLSLERFSELCAAYGEDLERWPEAEREAARVWLDGSAKARELARDEALLDAALGSLREPKLPAGLERRLHEIPTRARPARRGIRSWGAPAAVWAAAAALGLFLGTESARTESVHTTMAETLAEEARPLGEASDEEESLALAAGALAELEDEP